jgi:hypothetical protein
MTDNVAGPVLGALNTLIHEIFIATILKGMKQLLLPSVLYR